MENISYWKQEKDKERIIKGLSDYLERAKDILTMFVEDLQGTGTQLLCIANDDYYLFMVNLIDIFNGSSYENLIEDVDLDNLEVTEKGKLIYNFIKNNYKEFNDLDNRLSMDSNAMYDIEKYVPNAYDYFILSNLLKIIKK